jgi:large subunit ribosomal protein L7/L12
VETYSKDVRELGDAIVQLNVKQARELGEYIRDQYGIVASSAMECREREEGTVSTKVEAVVTLVDVVLTEVPDASKIGTIKVVRALKGLGLKESKDLVESAPVAVWSGVTADEGQKLKAAVEEAGAKVVLK